jgi:hypothetical protein
MGFEIVRLSSTTWCETRALDRAADAGKAEGDRLSLVSQAVALGYGHLGDRFVQQRAEGHRAGRIGRWRRIAEAVTQQA